MSSHAKLSPSSAHRWIPCPGSVILEKGIPDSSSEHAELGTAAHFLASECLEQNADAKVYIGEFIVIKQGNAQWNKNDPSTRTGYEVDSEMAEYVQTYLDAVRTQAQGNQLLVEQRVDFSAYLQTENAYGTSDAIVLTDTEIQVHDLKYGKGVQVYAEGNQQLQLYALGALNEFGILGDFTQVRMVIHMPRLGYSSEAVLTITELEEFANQARAAVDRIQALELGADAHPHTNPGDKQCQWCKAKATCPALQKHVLETIIGDFEDLTQLDLDLDIVAATTGVSSLDNERLAQAYAALPLLKQWMDAVDSQVHQKLHGGEEVPGFKLVEGRKGSRKWQDDEQAEQLLKSMRLKTEQMYDLKLISPTTAEKLSKGEIIGPRQWTKVQALIVQSDGKPTVVPASDKRPAIVINPVDDFEDLTLIGELS